MNNEKLRKIDIQTINILKKSIPRPFIFHDPYEFEETCKRNWPDNFINYVIIDPGKTFFCMRFEKRYFATEEYDEEIITKRFVLTNFNSKTERWKYHDTFYGRCTKILNQNFDLISKAHVIAIERQLPKNPKMIRMMQHLISYFVIKGKQLKNFPLIIDMDNQLKTKIFGYIKPKGLTKNQKKRHVKIWAVKKGYELLKERNDIKGIKIIQNCEKYDDPFDTVVMGEVLYRVLRVYEVQHTDPFEKNQKNQGNNKRQGFGRKRFF